MPDPFIRFRELLQRVPSAPLDVNCMHFMEYEGLPPADGGATRVVVRAATRRDIDALAGCRNTTVPVLAERFRGLDHCGIAFVEGNVAGYEWYCDRPAYNEERYLYRVEIPRDSVYAYDAFVLQEYRRAGVWKKLQNVYLRELMLRLGRHKVIAMVDYGNHVSMDVHLQFGFRRSADVFAFKFFGKSYCARKVLNPESATCNGPIADRAA